MKRRLVANRAQRKARKLTRILWVLVIAFATVLVATVYSAVATAPASAPVVNPSPSRTMVPPRATPTPSSTPTPLQTPSPQPAEPWTFKGAQLEVPCVGIKGPITEYTQEMLVDGAVEPAAMDTISWYSGIPGGILSRSATNTTYVYGHSWIHPAIFNNVRKMTPGCEAIITTGNGETLTYVMTEPVFSVMKPDLPSDPRVTEAKAGRLLLISCYRPDGYDPNAGTVENIVATLQLAPSEPVGEASVDSRETQSAMARP